MLMTGDQRQGHTRPLVNTGVMITIGLANTVLQETEDKVIAPYRVTGNSGI